MNTCPVFTTPDRQLCLLTTRLGTIQTIPKATCLPLVTGFLLQGAAPHQELGSPHLC